ncbi:shikimate dehydrogenase [candidate division KSB1 bacterium]|nr:shikimate dehydrogenase [candidate division KSB1 bacterium]
MIDNRTGLLGVIGDPIEHSLSPALHNFVLEKLNLNYCYHSFHVARDRLRDYFQGFHILDFRGINVTIPHKESVIPFMTQLSPEARILEAVNTIHFELNVITGYNTDSAGFLKSLGEIRNQLKNNQIIVLGAGGSARAIIYALITQQVGEIRIFNRTPAKAENLALCFRDKMAYRNIFGHPMKKDQLSAVMADAFLMINTTSVGMHPNVTASPLDPAIEIPASIGVYDLIYNPMKTQLLQRAQAYGAWTLNGLDMLIFQGIAALEIWLNRSIDAQPFLPELRRHLIALLGDASVQKD